MTRLPVITLVLAAALTAACGMTTAAEPRRPSILSIITDDQSPFDFSFSNPASTLEVPVIERLAAEGMIFDAAYQMGSFSGAVCTPSRHMVMSGRTVWHLPISPAGQSHCPPGLVSSTLAAVFNAAGYDTMRTCKNGNSYPAANRQFTVLHEAGKRDGTHQIGSGWHGDQVMNFLAEREQTADTDPFLIYLGFSHPHDTRNGTPELLEKYGATNHTDKATRPPARPGQPPLPANWLPKHPFDNGHMNVRDEVDVSGVWRNRDERTIRNERGREYACSENIDRQIGRLIAPLVPLASSLVLGAAAVAEQPNIVLVIADDQGYGDLGHTGNPVIQTPHLDALAAESTSLTDYHVAPTCSPTRAALLTGHWTDRTGVWHTINGRSMLRENEVTLGQLLADNGYATGMFGKWHLGDNFPYRPEDRGFAEVYRHGGGGVGQTPDCWDNAYFDGHYFHNGEVVPAEGFCTDVFFREAQRFIRREAEAGRPFFAYISTNAPHGPLHCPQEYLDRYPDQPAAIAAFFGMITNIDDNVGATRKLLAELGIADNTLFIFTTDNGTATGAKVFNAGMRGQKGSEYDGGHRVPFIAHWPAAGWNRQHACDRLCHAVDVVPTLVELAGGKRPEGLKWDGVSIRSLLDPAADTAGWPDRMLVTDSQRVRDPIKWKQTAVMSQRWRLVNGKELYDIEADPGQRNNVAADHPEQVAAMTAFYDAWWAELQPTFAQTTEIYLGHPEAAEVVLTCHDWIGPGECPWNQSRVRAAAGYPRPAADKKQPQNKQPDKQQPAAGGAARHEAHWAVKVVTAGDYTVAVRRWPAEANRAIVAGLPPGKPVPGASRAFRQTAGIALPAVSACLRIDGRDLETVAVEPDATVVEFTVPLATGSHELAPVFRTADGHEVGGYYCTVSGPLEP